MSILYNSFLRTVIFILAPVLTFVIAAGSAKGFLYVNLLLAGALFGFWAQGQLSQGISQKGGLQVPMVLIFGWVLILLNFVGRTGSLSFTRSIISLPYTMIIFHIIYSSQLNFNLYKIKKHLTKIIYFVGLTTVLYSIYHLLNPQQLINEEGRFLGWSGSPTTFSVYIMWFTVLALTVLPRKPLWRIVIFSILIGAVFLSKTRSSFIVAGAIILLYQSNIRRLAQKNIYLIIISFIALMIAISTSYEFFANTLNSIVGRYSDTTTDYSAMTRQLLIYQMIDIIVNTDLFSLLFGHGMEYTLQTLNSSYLFSDADIVLLPHNDFLRIIVDQGLVFFLWHTFLVISILARVKGYGIAPLLIYFSSYSHNMSYDHFNLLLLAATYLIIYKTQQAQENS